MKSVHKWATVATILIAISLLIFLLLFVKREESVIFAILSGVIASMIVMAMSNGISLFLAINQEKTSLKFKYTELIDTYADSLQIIKYSISSKSGIPGVNELISKYQEMHNQFQALFILHKRDKMPDYFNLQIFVENISTTIKKINNSHKIIKTDQEILNAYQEIKTFIISDKELDSFMIKVASLQDKSIVNQNIAANK